MCNPELAPGLAFGLDGRETAAQMPRLRRFKAQLRPAQAGEKSVRRRAVFIP